MIYDLEVLKAQNVPASALVAWRDCATCYDPKLAYKRTIDFYNTYGFNIFWAFKDQELNAIYGVTFSVEQKHQYVTRMREGILEL